MNVNRDGGSAEETESTPGVEAPDQQPMVTMQLHDGHELHEQQVIKLSIPYITLLRLGWKEAER